MAPAGPAPARVAAARRRGRPALAHLLRPGGGHCRAPGAHRHPDRLHQHRAACWKALSNLQIKQDNKLQALASMQIGLNLSTDLSPKEKTLKGLIDQAFKLMNGRR